MDHQTTRQGVRTNAILSCVGIAPTALLLFISEGFDVQLGILLATAGAILLAVIACRASDQARPRVDPLASVANAATLTGLGTVMASGGWDLILALYAGFTLLLVVTALIDRFSANDAVALTPR